MKHNTLHPKSNPSSLSRQYPQRSRHPCRRTKALHGSCGCSWSSWQRWGRRGCSCASRSEGVGSVVGFNPSWLALKLRTQVNDPSLVCSQSVAAVRLRSPTSLRTVQPPLRVRSAKPHGSSTGSPTSLRARAGNLATTQYSVKQSAAGGVRASRPAAPAGLLCARRASPHYTDVVASYLPPEVRLLHSCLVRRKPGSGRMAVTRRQPRSRSSASGQPPSPPPLSQLMLPPHGATQPTPCGQRA